MLSIFYNSYFGSSENGSKGEERGPRFIASEEVAALSRAVTSESMASGSSSASLDRLFASADVSTGAEEDQGQFQGE